MKILRIQSITKSLSPNRALIIYGPRRVGKTTLLRDYLKTQGDKQVISVVGEDASVRELFATEKLTPLSTFVAPYDIVAIDEAQYVPSIGLGLKMLIDVFPYKQFIATGSSSFELSNQVGEPLTGRHYTLLLLPFAQKEIYPDPFTAKNNLENTLLYGTYPEVLATSDTREKVRILKELISSYLYKDVLALEKIKSPALLRNIARMIAHQIGKEVSMNEIAVALQTDVKTVGRYLDLLEKMFVIKKAQGFSRNLRNEISKKARYYFLDNGIRNAVIDNFSALPLRNDVGALWENFCFMELVKLDNLTDMQSTFYFWRTHSGQEIDIIRETGGHITAYECKWNSIKTVKLPRAFAVTYPEVAFTPLTPETLWEQIYK